MLTVHHLGISQSERIVWLCEELEIPYELKRYDRAPEGGGPAAYKALHPYGTAPVITDGALTLGESGAIMEYIIHKYGNGRLALSPDKPNYADYLYWFHFANGTFMASSMIDLVARFLELEDSPMLHRMTDRTRRAFSLAEQRLGAVPYLAGNEFTAADIINVFTFTTMRKFVPRDLSSSPNTLAYLRRIGARPAYQRAMKKADPDMTPLLS